MRDDGAIHRSLLKKIYKKDNLMKKILLLVGLLGFFACNQNDEVDTVINGLKPVYATLPELQNIYAGPPIATESLGKIYAKPPYIYLNDGLKGVHVVDNSDPSNPVKVGFIHIPANTDIAIKDNIMYADNGPDLIAIDISDPMNVEVVSRATNTYDVTNRAYPILADGVYFECVDPTKGFVIGWEETSLENPKCRR